MAVRVSADPVAFDLAWDRFFASVKRARGRAARDFGGGLSVAQHDLLKPLAAGGELPVGELALAAGVATPTATRMLGGLARDGIVRRKASEADRRVVTVTLTPKGRRCAEAKRSLVQEKRRQIYESLDPRERERAAGLLVRLAEAVDEL
jgi:MarR family transcriptional regulator, organic hydroperoxide resistance regulator